MAGPPTIRTVAAHAGVSKSLVSLVLQNSPHVSEPKRQAVLKAVAELGYRPDPSARSLAERRTRTIGVVIDDLSNPWYVELLDGLRPVLHEHGLRPLLADGHTEPDAVQALADLRVDGLVVVGTPTLSAIDQVERLAGQIPTVVAGTREPRLSAVDVVANDDYRGARLATAHLLESDIVGSPTSWGKARWVDSVAQASRRRSPMRYAGCAMHRRRLDGGHWTAGRDGAPAFLPTSDRDLRRERPLGGRCAGRSGRPRLGCAGGPVRCGLRQHCVRPAAPPLVDHDRRSHRGGGAGGRPDTDCADRRGHRDSRDAPSRACPCAAVVHRLAIPKLRLNHDRQGILTSEDALRCTMSSEGDCLDDLAEPTDRPTRWRAAPCAYRCGGRAPSEPLSVWLPYNRACRFGLDASALGRGERPGSRHSADRIRSGGGSRRGNSLDRRCRRALRRTA